MGDKAFYERDFLNLEGFNGVAAIMAEVTVTEPKDTGYNRGSVDGRLQISDCTESVELEFYWYRSEKKDTYKDNTLYKLNKLVDTITAFRDSYVEEIERIEALGDAFDKSMAVEKV